MPDPTETRKTGAFDALDAADRERSAAREATTWDAALAAAIAAKAQGAPAPAAPSDAAPTAAPAGTAQPPTVEGSTGT